MMRRNAVAAVLFGSMMVIGCVVGAEAQTTAVPGAVDPAAPATLPALPVDPNGATTAVPGPAPAPGAIPGAAPADATLPPAAMPALPGLPADASSAPLPGALPTPVPFGAPATLPGQPDAAASTVPAPPALDQIGVQSSNGTSQAGSAPAAAAPSQLYTFLFVEMDEYGTVRHKFNNDVADSLKEQEIQRLETQRSAPANNLEQTLGITGLEGGIAPANVGTESRRAAAEWDFYYNQLEMYDKFVREKLIPGAEDLPELSYNAADALQERQDLFESFQQAAIQQSSADYNANKQFYERLAQREDRRQAYLEWLTIARQQTEDWSAVWARKVYGDRWADGEEVRLDDWYYGKDFNSINPVTVAIADREYVISRNPVGKLQDGQLNVISSNLTPYDIIDANGVLKNPVMETLRGTLVLPPAPPVYSTSPGPSVTGASAPPATIQIVGGATSE